MAVGFSPTTAISSPRGWPCFLRARDPRLRDRLAAGNCRSLGPLSGGPALPTIAIVCSPPIGATLVWGRSQAGQPRRCSRMLLPV